LKCDKCGYVSFDHNLTCPECNKDLSIARNRLGNYFEPPETTFDLFFAQDSGAYRTIAPVVRDEAELELDTTGDEFEFSLDD